MSPESHHYQSRRGSGQVGSKARYRTVLRGYRTLGPADRSKAGYHQFAEGAVERIRFIKRAQALGFTLEEIAGVLELRLRESEACSPVKAVAEGKITEIDGKIASLRRLRRGLIPIRGCVPRGKSHQWVRCVIYAQVARRDCRGASAPCND